jgi:predicted acetyltransferase
MQIELVRAALADQPRIANLLELYLHDFSEIVGFAPDDDGHFGYAGLDAYWTEPGRHPFLIRAGGELAGFALIGQGSQVSGDPAVFDVAEFFIVRGMRRRGAGSAAAAAVFAAFAGPWEVRVMSANHGALPFWERAISDFTRGRFESIAWHSPRDTAFRVFRFAGPG